MRWATLAVILGWWAVVGASMWWNVAATRAEHRRFVHSVAQSVFQHILVTRDWNARHGGVYVPVTDTVQPNPYLDEEGRDIRVNDGLTLTKINPAYMTRQIAELVQGVTGIQFHITSLKPIRPENGPTALERHALQLFEQGYVEFGEFRRQGADDSYFYMAPLVATEACLRCHEKQGYKLYDIRGGISVTLPGARPARAAGIIIGHLLTGLAGATLIFILMRHLTRAYDSVRHQSIMDALTGVPNRRHFTERLLEEFRRAQRYKTPLTLVICDIDHFKKFNDHYGHVAGDHCLAEVAHAMKSALCRPGDVVARYGGEEFVMILPNTNLAGGVKHAEVIRKAVEDLRIPHAESTASDWVTLSVGVATQSGTDAAYEALINRADGALYRAKAEGRNRVIFDGQSGGA